MNQIELVDSHTHLMDEQFIGEVETIIQNAKKCGVTTLINMGYSKETSLEAIELAEKYDGIYAAIGMHPDECNCETDVTFLRELSQNKKVVAIGEVGLDYHYEETNKETQAKYFIEQIKLANDLKLPVCIHSRDSDMDMLKVLKENKIENGFVMHCFSSSMEILKEMLKLDAYISLAGPVTFKNAKGLLDVAKEIPIDKLLVETDAPYLSPEPFRGKRNEPANVLYTATKIAELRGISLTELAKKTTENAKRFYRISI